MTDTLPRIRITAVLLAPMGAPAAQHFRRPGGLPAAADRPVSRPPSRTTTVAGELGCGLAGPETALWGSHTGGAAPWRQGMKWERYASI